MSKLELKSKARNLRSQGESVCDIAKQLKISKSTASLWCSDIVLSPAQIHSLNEKQLKGGYAGRLKGAAIQKQKKIQRIQYFESLGIKKFNRINDRELLVLGLGLYFGEGSKGSKFQFTNSNVALTKIICLWLKRIFKVNNSDFDCRVLVNKIYEKDTKIIEKEWSDILGIPLSQFKRTSLINTVNRKVYEKRGEYRGTLALRVKKSSDLQYKVLGLMKGLLYNLRM